MCFLTERELQSAAFKDSLGQGPDDLWANGRGLTAARCRCDARSLLRHGRGEGEVNGKDLLSSKLARMTAAASCSQSTGLPAVTPWKQG